jgi:putative Holliday junction resolvase
MRYLAIDYGMRRTGLAICDPGERMVSPLGVIRDPKGLIDRVVEIIGSEGVGEVVIGLPLNMDGSHGPQAQRSRAFAERLAQRVSIPIHFQDERLSSFEAGRRLAAIGRSGRKGREMLDALAAADILERFLETRTPD